MLITRGVFVAESSPLGRTPPLHYVAFYVSSDYHQLTVTGIFEKGVSATSDDIDAVQEYTSSPSSRELGGGANDRTS
jgi:hypothetical protein